MRRRVLFDGESLIIDLQKDVKIQLKNEGWVEIEGENSNLRVLYDGADIRRIEHELHNAKVSEIDTNNSYVAKNDAKIFIEPYEEDI